MAIRVAVRHHTSYQYDRPVSLSPHVFRLRPAPHCRTPIRSFSLKIEPSDHFINWQQDPFGNYIARIIFHEKVSKLSIDVEVIADMTVINPFDFFMEDYADKVPFEYEAQAKLDLAPYLAIAEDGPLLRELVSQIDRTPLRTVDFLVALNQRIQGLVGYLIRLEPGIQSCEQTLALKSGSCRDSAWLLVQVLRHLGLAARFVSGYLVQLSADEKSLDGPSGPPADFTDLHAWAEVYAPGAGWMGLDPTSGLFAGEGHIPLACTAEPSSAAPVTGATDLCETEFSFENSVVRIYETPRVTKPYTDAQWNAINALGSRVDQELITNDVRLTMGGEPTFVSIDDMNGAQWNTEALGEEKRVLAEKLLLRLMDQFGKGGALHFGQGKWYPGEPLPRWALSCFWRPDGIAVWKNPSLIDTSEIPPGISKEQAFAFAEKLASRLGIPKAMIVPGFEDRVYHTWKEACLPVEHLAIDTAKSKEERQKLLALLESSENPVGYAIPLAWNLPLNAWESSRWEFQRGNMYLSPGDSPMGLRLPLTSLAPETQPQIFPLATFATRPQLPAADHAASKVPENSAPLNAKVRTALCVEARDGRLFVFLPPLAKIEHVFDLLSHLEATAKELQIPLRLEGYMPPWDPRLERFSITPDPGVIEVNIHPSRSWPEMVSRTETVYEEAKQSRLCAEKFMLDGRHAGTGGGNHITLGGASPADSPLLRRPHLIRSLVSYWQNHPSLSYLFSGMFIGPTSQAPRIDEARNDALYELEIAFEQLPSGDTNRPWLVDRALRNLLVDVTGNTHRAEFCIDKLYSPDTDSGRLGILEMRAFEMPPHAKMSLAQQLLVRSLVARFWEKPYERPLIRWGTQLADRFMMPFYVWQDFIDVCKDMNENGYSVDPSWYDPFFEFRFPKIGELAIDGITMELRMALEPWHVLGEHVVSGGTSRYVDSSVERIQLTIDGATPGRHIVTCNQHRLPLRNSGRGLEQVAAVRYKAWDPPSGLHPSIGSHAPLVFEIVDSWQSKAIAGCRYFVSHPGGRHYETFPVNANEAEARRYARFWGHGHSAGRVEIPEEEGSKEHNFTLDLRKGV